MTGIEVILLGCAIVVLPLMIFGFILLWRDRQVEKQA